MTHSQRKLFHRSLQQTPNNTLIFLAPDVFDKMSICNPPRWPVSHSKTLSRVAFVRHSQDDDSDVLRPIRLMKRLRVPPTFLMLLRVLPPPPPPPPDLRVNSEDSPLDSFLNVSDTLVAIESVILTPVFLTTTLTSAADVP
jgi:hypothetical protein